MEFQYHEKIPVKNERNAAKVATSNLVKNRRNLEVVEENNYDDSYAEVILKHTAKEEKSCERRHIVVSGENDIVTINAFLKSEEHVPSLKVGIKGTARNIYSTVAGRVEAEQV
jgi:hypothetical protein